MVELASIGVIQSVKGTDAIEHFGFFRVDRVAILESILLPIFCYTANVVVETLMQSVASVARIVDKNFARPIICKYCFTAELRICIDPILILC